jgi:hypothetical protein
MIDEHGRVPSTELNSSHPSRPGAQERLGLRRRTTSFATGATGHDEVIPRACMYGRGTGGRAEPG